MPEQLIAISFYQLLTLILGPSVLAAVVAGIFQWIIERGKHKREMAKIYLTRKLQVGEEYCTLLNLLYDMHESQKASFISIKQHGVQAKTTQALFNNTNDIIALHNDLKVKLQGPFYSFFPHLIEEQRDLIGFLNRYPMDLVSVNDKGEKIIIEKRLNDAIEILGKILTEIKDIILKVSDEMTPN